MLVSSKQYTPRDQNQSINNVDVWNRHITENERYEVSFLHYGLTSMSHLFER